MCYKGCKYCFYTVMAFVRILCVHFINRIMKLTLWELLWSILGVILVSYFMCRDRKVEDTLEAIPDNPVLVWWTEGFPSTSETRYCPGSVKCDVFSTRNLSFIDNVQAYLFYGSNLNFSDMPKRKPRERIWGLYHEESPRNVEELMHEVVLNLFNYSSTYSRYSDVPYPLQYLNAFEDITSRDHFIGTSEKNSHLSEISPILYLQSDCETSTERDIFVIELMKYVQVDSYGACLNNKELPTKFTEDYLNNLNGDEFLRFVSRYKFVIAIENGVCDDYITEKFWRAIKVGSVPIYFGSPTIKYWFPNEKSAILLEDFPTPKILSSHLKRLLESDDLYEEYLEHKTKQIVTNKRLVEEYKERPYQLDSLRVIEKFECYICEMLHKKIAGHSAVNVVNKKHYNCPKPLSALTLDINPTNSWVQTWDYNRVEAERIYKRIMNTI